MIEPLTWRPSIRHQRRIRDGIVAVSLILLSPLFVAVALAIKFTDGGSVIHTARRMGRRGKTFALFKFRTMVVGAAAMGPGVTGAADPRVTRVGAFLRRTKLDELPQLVNVLQGDMDLVGPRPEDPRYLPYYTRDQLKVLDARPGITSLVSLQFADESSLLVGEDWESQYLGEVLPAKLQMELGALREYSFPEEVAMVLRTVAELVRSCD